MSAATEWKWIKPLKQICKDFRGNSSSNSNRVLISPPLVLMAGLWKVKSRDSWRRGSMSHISSYLPFSQEDTPSFYCVRVFVLFYIPCRRRGVEPLRGKWTQKKKVGKICDPDGGSSESQSFTKPNKRIYLHICKKMLYIYMFYYEYFEFCILNKNREEKKSTEKKILKIAIFIAQHSHKIEKKDNWRRHSVQIHEVNRSMYSLHEPLHTK